MLSLRAEASAENTHSINLSNTLTTALATTDRLPNTLPSTEQVWSPSSVSAHTTVFSYNAFSEGGGVG